MFAALLLVGPSSAQIFADARRKIDGAQSLEIAMDQYVAEFPDKHGLIFYWWRKGGFLRADSSEVTDIGNPKAGWSYWEKSKEFVRRPPLPTSYTMSDTVGLDGPGKTLRFVGVPQTVTWDGDKALKIEVDARAQTTRGAKVYYFFDPTSHLPLGVSANLGSVTQIRRYRMYINPVIPGHKFEWTPPKGWKELKGRD